MVTLLSLVACVDVCALQWKVLHVFRHFGVVHYVHLPSPRPDAVYRFG